MGTQSEQADALLRTFVHVIERDCKPVWPGIIMAAVNPDRYVAFRVQDGTAGTMLHSAGEPGDLAGKGVKVALFCIDSKGSAWLSEWTPSGLGFEGRA